MISTGSGLVWNGLLKAFGSLPGPILSVFFDFPNNYVFDRPPRGLFLTVFNHQPSATSMILSHHNDLSPPALSLPTSVQLLLGCP